MEEEGWEGPIPTLGLLSGPLLLSWAEERATEGEGEGSGAGKEMGCPGKAGVVLMGVPGALNLREETVCGLLVVGGDLNLGDGAQFYGVALVGGDLSLEGNGRLAGLARIRGAVTLADNAQILGSPCAALWALIHLPGVQRPYLLPDGYRIHGF